MRTFVRLAVAACVLHVVVGVGRPVSAGFPVETSAKPGWCDSVPNVGALSGFGVGLLGAVSGEGRENALVSPLGIGAVLAMLTPGAKDPVRRSIWEMLGVGSNHTESTGTDASETTPAADEPAAGATSAGDTYAGDDDRMRILVYGEDDSRMRMLVCQLERVRTDQLKVKDGELVIEHDEGAEVEMANGAFADRRLDLFPAFAAVFLDRFRVRVQRLDFSDEGSVGRINSWVDSATHGAIPRLVSSLEPDDVLVLVNALRFRGEWTHRFDPGRTAPAPFHLRSGASVEVPAMQADDLPARYREDDGFQAVALPYGDGDFRFVVVLPRAGTAAPDALGRLAADPSWLEVRGFRRSRGSLTLPRMTLEEDVSLLPVLRQLGLESALEDTQAFAGIAAPAPTLSRVLHRTMLVLDEKGTEAAAATAAVMTTRSAPVEDRFEVKVDRPFAFAVVHRDTGAALFVGWVANPLGG